MYDKKVWDVKIDWNKRKFLDENRIILNKNIYL
jgi:hypothetical protein